MHKKRFSRVALLYMIVAILVAVVSLVSITLAWYIKTNTENINIKFANPIKINLYNDFIQTETMTGDVDNLLPGSKIGVKLGIEMENGSSNAYVRARIALVFDNVYDDKGKPVSWSEFVDVKNAISDSWVEVDFSNDPNKQDIWYVCKKSGGSTTISREVSAGDNIEFANGAIEISRMLDNRFAEKKMNIVFTVESLQVQGVEDPLAYGVSNARLHPVWGS